MKLEATPAELVELLGLYQGTLERIGDLEHRLLELSRDTRDDIDRATCDAANALALARSIEGKVDRALTLAGDLEAGLASGAGR